MIDFHTHTPRGTPEPGSVARGSARRIAALARRHPELPLVLGHGGLHDRWREALALTRKTPNLCLCLCGTPPYAARHILAKAPSDKVLFGTVDRFLAEFADLLPPLDPDTGSRTLASNAASRARDIAVSSAMKGPFLPKFGRKGPFIAFPAPNPSPDLALPRQRARPGCGAMGGTR